MPFQIILDRKKAIERLAQEDDDDRMGMAHSLLSGLPSIIDSEIPLRHPNPTENQQKENPVAADLDIKPEEDGEETTTRPTLQDTPAAEQTTISDYATISEKVTEEANPVHHINPETLPIPKEDTPTSEDLATDFPSTPDRPEAGPSTPPSRSPSPAHAAPKHVTPTALTSLLTHADALWTLYPPTHPEMGVSSIMGPQSVVFTWSENFKQLPGDRDAEAMVGCPDLIVYPYIEEEEDVGEDDVDGWDEKEKKGRRTKGKGRERGKGRRHPRKLRKTRVVERRTMVAGAVLVLGVAMAVYGVKVHSGGGRGGGGGVFGLGFGLVEPGKEWKGLKKIGGWVGGLMVGATERVLSAGGHGGAKT